MKSDAPARPYRMTARAQAAEQTAQNILAATVALWKEISIEQITLQMIAERAGVTVQTVIRRFGSKDGVIEACIERDSTGLAAERAEIPVGDVTAALDTLLAHYERDGDSVLRMLAVEEQYPIARKAAGAGRQIHRQTCARIFAPYLPASEHKAYSVRLDAFVAATDIFIWKLLRRDLGRPADETKRVFRHLVDGLIALPIPDIEET